MEGMEGREEEKKGRRKGRKGREEGMKKWKEEEKKGKRKERKGREVLTCTPNLLVARHIRMEFDARIKPYSQLRKGPRRALQA